MLTHARLLTTLSLLAITAMGIDAQAIDFEELRTIGGPGNQEMTPSGVAVDALTGNIYVADTGNNRVGVYRPDGTRLRTMGSFGHGAGQLWFPRDLDVDEAGNVYVTDSFNKRVVKFAGDGTFITAWQGPASDTLNDEPMGINVKGGKVYVGGAGNTAIRVWNSDLNVEYLKLKSTGDCTLYNLREADADTAGNIYVTNVFAGYTLKFAADGACLGRLNFPSYSLDVAYDPVLQKELIYVAYGGFSVYQLDGTPVTPGPIPLHETRFMGAGPDGSAWVAQLHDDLLARFTRTSDGWIPAPTFPADPAPPRPLDNDAVFNKVEDVSFESDGTVIAVDFMFNRFVRFTPGGEVINACGSRDIAGWPKSVAVDKATGQIWYPAGAQNRYLIMQPDCRVLYQFPAQGGQRPLRDTAIVIRASDRTAFVADKWNNRVIAFDVATRAQIAAVTVPAPESGRLWWPAGITINPSNDNVLVVEELNNRVTELSYTGGSFGFVRTIQGGFSRPRGVAADSIGNIYVADGRNNRVVALDRTGAVVGTITGLLEPEGVSVGANDELFVSDSFNGVIRVYRQVNQLANPGFETDLSAWRGAGASIVTSSSNVHSGSKAAQLAGTSGGPLRTYFYQVVRGLSAAHYSASIWYRRTVGVTWAQLGVKVINNSSGALQYEAITPMVGRDSWAEARVNDIPVTGNDRVQVYVYADEAAGGALYLDDAAFR